MITSKKYLTVFSLFLFILLASCDKSPPVLGQEKIHFTGPILIEDLARQRSFETLVWYPASLQNKHFLVLIAHGMGGLPEDFTWLGEYLASHGYVAAAIKFPYSNRGQRDKMNLDDLPNQPQDLRVLVDAIIKGEQAPLDSLKGRINTQQIAVAGHSFGGLTSYLVGYDRELADPRVAATIILAAAGGDFLTEKFYGDSQIPMLLLHGDLDRLVEYKSTSLQAYQNYPHAMLAKFIGGSHLGLSNGPEFGINPDNIACWFAGDILDTEGKEINFYNQLRARTPDTGLGDYSAPLPCKYDLPDVTLMPTSRMRYLSAPLILSFIQTHLNKNKEASEAISALASEHSDLEIHPPRL